MMGRKIVKFSNGTYAIRISNTILMRKYLYIDLEDPSFLWSKDSEYFKDCIGPKETCEKILIKLDRIDKEKKDMGKPVKLKIIKEIKSDKM